jgi:hypothetical protein
MLFLGAAVVVAAVFLTEPEPTPTAKAKRPAITKAKSKSDPYTAADYAAKFPPVNVAAKNAFKPLIVRNEASLQALRSDGSEIPLLFSGGKGRWTYTGYVELNGRPTALIEDGETGEGEYLVAGQTWRNARVLTITNSSLVLAGPEGVTRSIRLASSDADSPVNEMVAPVTPNLSGPIGAGPTVRPLDPRPVPATQ